MRGFPPNHLFLKTPVRHVSSEHDGRLRVHLENGTSEVYDHVILATHGDQALSIIEPSATEHERSILSCFKTSQGEAVLHSDVTLLPRRQTAWAAWNYLTLSIPSSRRSKTERVSLTYNMNILQHIPRSTFGDVLVTLNPLHKPRPEQTQGRYYYSNPIFTPSTVRAQKLLRYIQNTRGISYAGAWTKYGYHEDGFSSGLHVAEEHLNARLPFEFKEDNCSKCKKPTLGMTDLVLRILILLVQIFVIQISEKITGTERKNPKPVVKSVRFGKTNGKII